MFLSFLLLFSPALSCCYWLRFSVPANFDLARYAALRLAGKILATKLHHTAMYSFVAIFSIIPDDAQRTRLRGS